MRIRIAPLVLALTAALAPAPGAAQDGTLSLAGRVHSADGGSVAGTRVVVRSGAHTDSAVVDSAGGFSLRVPPPPRGRKLRVLADASDGTGPRYHPSFAAVRADSIPDPYHIVLVPVRWAIASGRFAGDTVDISLRRAFDPVCFGCSSFFRNAAVGAPNASPAPLPSWPASAFPLRVAFDPQGAAPVTTRDSAAFWRIVAELEAELGSEVFRPTTLRETAPGGGSAPEDVVLVILDPSLRAVGWGSSVSQRGDIIYGTIRVRDGRVFSSPEGPELIKHELMHALGVGHTCGWTSALADYRVCPRRRSPGLTREDVAYARLLFEVGDLQRVLGAQQGLEAALAGERGFVP